MAPCSCRERKLQRNAPADWSLRLAKLATPAAPPLQRMVLEDQRLPVPAGQHARFRDEFYPRLRRLAAVTSSDGSFTPPAISGPTLVLRATYGDRHDLDDELGVGLRGRRCDEAAPARIGRRRRHPGPGGANEPCWTRSTSRWSEFGLRGDGPDWSSRPRCGGLDTMRFATEVLPLLADAPDVVVEVSGTSAAYREAGDSLQIGVSTERDRRARRTGSTSASRDASRDARSRSRTCSWRWPRASRTCCCPTARTSPCRSPSCRRCARSSRRRGPCRTRRAGRCGSAGSRRACGRSWPRWASSSARPRRGSSRSRACCRSIEARRNRAARGPVRAAAALPARGVRLAVLPLAPPARRHPRRRHGSGQDAADARADLSRHEHAGRRGARSSSSRRPASSPTGRPRRRGSRPVSRW